MSELHRPIPGQLTETNGTLETSEYVEFGEKYLRFAENTPFEVWSEVVKRLKSAEKSIQWWIGDALKFGERKYGEMYSQALEATDYTYGALANMAYVAGRVESSLRNENLTWSHHVAVAPLEPEEQELLLEEAEREKMPVRAVREKAEEMRVLPPERAMEVHYSSETGEWYTPGHVAEKVISVLGGVTLDPCSEPAKGIPAEAHLTKDDDGLSYEWSGTVYMNPPYGREISPWVEKLKAHHEAGEVTAAIALVPARTDTEWFAMLDAYPRCFIRGRLKFGGGKNSAPFPSAAVYMGPHKAGFVQAFSELGTIFEAVKL